uniref:NADH-ubiquinone oxidoreductase chain 2 n=1 Tax=Typosyllis antoni TaxID=1898412 RepID=A0A1C9UZE8_9ANNE|nr:NADH dehydrogenase subunit 2 [Typosyllis antoni]AOR87150.1 NADH dehydrogenase subunit 2 [Typosyllis antoni]
MITKPLSPSYILFFSTLMLSTMMIMTASNWIMVWMSMEMNLMSFIPLMLSSSTHSELEAATKYFLMQSIGSAMMLTSIFMFNSLNLFKPTSLIFCLSMMLKMGMAPLHLWLPQILNNMTWVMILLTTTWQKIGPMSVLSYMSTMWMYQTITIIAAANIMIGVFGGLSQSQMRPLIAYSSISHMGWMLSSMILSSTIMVLYLILYFIVSLSALTPLILMEKQSSSKHNLTFNNPQNLMLMTSLNMLSMGGMPPMLGFIPKWMVISMLIKISPLLTLSLTTLSMISLYFYLKITMTIIMNMMKSTSYKINTNITPIILFLTIPQTMVLLCFM